GNPCQSANFFFLRFRATGFAVMCAVWRKPCSFNLPTFANGNRVNVPYRFDKVVCVRVVHVVHAQCFFVVVDRNINRTTERHFHAERCTATAGKIVDKQFFRQVQAKLATIGIVNVHYAATSSSTRVTFSQRTHCSSSHVSSVNETKPS